VSDQDVNDWATPDEGKDDWASPSMPGADAKAANPATAVATGVLNLPGARDVATLGATAGSYIPGAEEQTGTFGERYNENKRWLDTLSAASAKQHPYLYYGSGIASSLPLGGAGVPKTILGAAGVGGAMGAASGAGEGVGLKERGENAILGGVGGGLFGGALKGAGEGLGYLGNKIWGTVRTPEDIAMERTTGPLKSDVTAGRGVAEGRSLSEPDWKAAQAAGYPVVAADLGGGPTKALARSVANASPEARDTLQNMVAARATGQNQRMGDLMDGIFGGGQLDTKVARDSILRNAQSQNAANYTAAYDAPTAQAVWNSDLQNLLRSPTVQGVLGDAQKKAENYAVQNKLPMPNNPFKVNPDGTVDLAVGPNGQTQTPSLMYWDQVKRSLQDSESTALRTGDKETAKDVGTLKRSLLDNLDQAVPEYKTARQGAMAGFNAENSLDAGLNYLKETRPDQLNQMNAALAKLNPADKAEFSRGFGAAVQGKALNSGDNRSIVNQFNNPITRQKFENALGPANAAKIEASLRWERAMEGTNRAVMGNSTTVQQFNDMAGDSPFNKWGEFGRRVAEGAVAGKELTGGSHIGALAGGTFGAVGHLFNQAALKAGANPEIANFIASNLASGDPQRVNSMLTHIASRPMLMKVLRGVEQGIPSAGPTAGAAVGTFGPSSQQ
jgi:hypothetical protein